MRNLKKVLALALALAMTLTFFANAAFIDAEDIDSDTQVAIDTLVALGVLAGDPDGSFRPLDSVTRGEAAKIIFTIRNKGNSDATGFESQSSKFTDIANHWARGYIIYCESLGIVSGKSDTLFYPDDQVTGSELAKMLLTMLGYKSGMQGYTGTSWELNVLADATDAGILDNYAIAYGAGAPRQWAALQAYNALYAATVKYDNDGNLEEEERTATISDIPVKVVQTAAYKYFGLMDAKGIVEVADDEYITIDDVDYEVENAYQYLGYETKILYKYDSSNEIEVYDAVVTAKNKVVTTTWNNIDQGDKDSAKIEVDDKEYALDGSDDDEIYVSVNYGTPELQDSTYFTATNRNDPVTLIDNDGDGKYNYAVIIEKSFGKIGTISDDEEFYYTKKSGSVTSQAYDFEDAETYDGMEKGDYVLAWYNEATDKLVVEKTSEIEGKIRGMKGDSYSVSGTYYDLSEIYVDLDTVSVGDSYVFYTDGAYILGAEVVESETPTNFAMITAIDYDTSFQTDTWKVKVILGSGSTGTYTVEDNEIIVYDASGDEVTVDLEDYDDPDDAYAEVGERIYTYSISSGEISLEEIDDAGSMDVARMASSFDEDDETIDGDYFIDDSAVIFVHYDDDGDDEWDVVTGKEVKAYADPYGDGTVLRMGYVEKSGLNYIIAGALLDPNTALPNEDNDLLFGMLTSKSWYEKDENDDYYEYYELWNGSETVTVKREMSSQSDYDAIAKASAVSYRLNSDGSVDEIAADLTVAALTGFDLTNEKISVIAGVEVDGEYPYTGLIDDVRSSVYSLDDDCVIIYVDRDDADGVASADLEKADETVDGERYVTNVAFKKNGSGDVIALIFDIDNNWED